MLATTCYNVGLGTDALLAAILLLLFVFPYVQDALAGDVKTCSSV